MQNNEETTNKVQQINTFRRVFPQVCWVSQLLMGKISSENTDEPVFNGNFPSAAPSNLFTLWLSWKIHHKLDFISIQILATLAKNLIIFNLGEFIAFPSIVIPSLAGLNTELNPDESVHATGPEISWLCEFHVVFLSVDE